jgi:hypothetical protein
MSVTLCTKECAECHTHTNPPGPRASVLPGLRVIGEARYVTSGGGVGATGEYVAGGYRNSRPSKVPEARHFSM